MSNETLFPCPFCGSTNIDPEGWASDKTHGPACVNCSAPSPLIAPAPVEGDVLRKLVEVADTNPFCSVGHFVEHVAPETRASLAALTGQAKKGESK